ncbi:MAG TPA: DUF4249 domain-containing protein [Puia sp.]|jgi:hypothetical protein|nr:DUF4249 domain-containing protein [Puia sp.]
MKLQHYISSITLILTTGLITCRQPYTPPVITNPNRYLVVDGFINTGTNAVTSFNLNWTRNLGDTTIKGLPELDAQISIVGSNGSAYPLTDTAGIGIYTSAPLTLDITQQYHLTISTSNGQLFSSDPVPCEPTPPIDSIFWRQPSDLTIYASTHDPSDATHYYRYDYNETWEHDSQLKTAWGVANGMIYAVDSTTQKNRCWTTDTSANILLASSAVLARDAIDSFPLVVIPNSDPRVDIAYSILVRQYGLTEGAYNYWQLIQKTTQNVGTLFDVQPTQLIGNIHCTSNPAEPVIGYLYATNVQQQRIYVFESSLHDWIHNQPGFGCDTTAIPQDFNNPFAYNYPNPDYAPWYFITFGPLVLASKICLDCTLVGGTNIRPSFMPD